MSLQTVRLRRLIYGIPPVVHMVQADTGRNLKMIIEDEVIAAGSVGVLCFERPDGSEYDQPATFSAADNSFTANCTQALTNHGIVRASLRCADSSGDVSSFMFFIDVQKSPSGVIEEQRISTVQSAILIAQEAKAESDASTRQAKAASDLAALRAQDAEESADSAEVAAKEAAVAAESAREAAQAALAFSGGYVNLTDQRDSTAYGMAFTVTADGRPAVILTKQ